MLDPRCDEKRPCVYRVYDADGVLLYVGSTKAGVRRRLRKHRLNGARWIPFGAEVEVRFYASEETAHMMEREAIILERPRYNFTFNCDPARLTPRE